MTKLQILNASGIYCQFNDESIKYLNLIELNASDNWKITNISHMTNLKILEACGWSKIDNKQIFNLNLIRLNSLNNDKITLSLKKI